MRVRARMVGVGLVTMALAVSACAAGQPASSESRSRPADAGTASEFADQVIESRRAPKRVVTLLLNRDSYPTYGRVVARGQLRPAAAHRRVVVQRRVGTGDWRAVGRTRTRDDGGYALRLPNRNPGQWRVRAYSPPVVETGVTARSRVKMYDVNAVLRPVVTRVTRAQLGRTWRPGCPVGPAQLRDVRVTFHTYGPLVRRGTLVVHQSIVDDIRAVFRVALRTSYPIRRMRPVSFYGGSDLRSMRADNTSAFNCRDVVGEPGQLSNHSYGTAIDVNTVRNPYQDSSGRWYPRDFGASYRDRSRPRPGMLYARSPVTRAFLAHGFRWGGTWSNPDYQHFD